MTKKKQQWWHKKLEKPKFLANISKIIKAEEINIRGKIGEIIDHNLTIGCFNNSLRILEIQKEGKKILNSKEFLDGYKIKKGEIIN